MKIGFVGLGKLGLPCAVAIESKGHQVIGYDKNPEIKEYIKKGEIPYREKGMELLKKSKIKVESLETVVEQSDIVFVAVQTPHDPMYEGQLPVLEKTKDFNYSYLKKAVNDIADIVCVMNHDVVVCVISTVLPGTMDDKILPLIKNVPGMKIVYNPFFIAMGTTIDDFLNPEFVLIGVHDKPAADLLEVFYKSVIKDPLFKIMDIRSAEATKVLYNTFITQKIVFANAVGELCEATGADANSVISAITSGSRRIISSMYMQPGMGDGGGCHPRDNIALSHVAEKYNICDIWKPMMKARDQQTKNMAEMIVKTAYEHNMKFIILLGASFKPETNITTGSPALLLYYYLNEIRMKYQHTSISFYDPHVDPEIGYKLNPGDLQAVYFVSTNHDIFHEIQFAKGSVVIDPWGTMARQEEVTYIYPGRHL